MTIKKWALVENGAVKRFVDSDSRTTVNEITSVPLSERRGWYSVFDNIPVLEPWESLGAASQVIDDALMVVTITYAVDTIPLDVYQNMRITKLKDNGSQEIYRVAPPYKQDNVALGVSGYEAGSPKATTIINHIETTIADINAREAVILAATTHAAANAVDITFVGGQ